MSCFRSESLSFPMEPFREFPFILIIHFFFLLLLQNYILNLAGFFHHLKIGWDIHSKEILGRGCILHSRLTPRSQGAHISKHSVLYITCHDMPCLSSKSIMCNVPLSG